MAKITTCHWSPTGHAFETQEGACSCRIAAPPGMAMYKGEIAALEYKRELTIAEALSDQERLDELADETPPDYQKMLASANERLGRKP